MSISVNLPLDNGYLRRECPNCERQFKWHNGPTDERPQDVVDPAVYFCPYCGVTAAMDQWWTTEQAEHMQQLMLGEGTRIIGEAFGDLERKTRNSLIKFKVTGTDTPEPPGMMHEPSDMVIVQSPCHPWEPIKVGEEWSEPLHCLVCGARFATS